MRLQSRLSEICIVRFLDSGFFVGQNRLITVLNHLENQQNTQLNAEAKNQASNRHIFGVLGRLYNLCG